MKTLIRKNNHASQRKVPATALRNRIGRFEFSNNGEDTSGISFRMVARSGDAIEHWYWGNVVHDLAGMRMHKERLPIDYGHDEKEIIGYADEFDVSSGDLIVRGMLIPTNGNDRASEVATKAKRGVPYEASINFGGDGTVIEEVPPGESVRVNSRDFTGPLTIFREWPLRGIAVCPYGQDANTSTEFAAGTVSVSIAKPQRKGLASKIRFSQGSLKVFGSAKRQRAEPKKPSGFASKIRFK